jgi:hypothetical protein
MTAQTGYNLTAAILASHPDIKYWLISGFFDDYTDGAARAVDTAGKTDNTVCSTFGGSGLINHWDAGEPAPGEALSIPTRGSTPCPFLPACTP